MLKRKKLLFVTAMHGDEPLNVELAKHLERTKLGKKFDWIIANPRALKQGVRFTEADLNRVFPGKAGGNYEERRAFEISKIIRRYDRTVDLHGTVSKTGIFTILTRFTPENLELALRFKTQRVVLWPEMRESSGSLSTFSACGIELETGPKKSVVVRKQLEKIVRDFLAKLDQPLDLAREIKKRQFFLAGDKILEKDNRRKFVDWKKAGDFYPLFVGQYPGIACFKLKQVNPRKYFKF